MNAVPALNDFHPLVRQWFLRSYAEPSPPQVLGWPSISAGKHTLILAPTGSGKTLAAFLWAINHLVEQHIREHLPRGVRILYVSPLKALNNDIERNLEIPLSGIRNEAASAGISLPSIRTAVRTGDTPQSRRAAMQRNPPDILITTPESLYLMLTSRRSRPMFRTVQYVIIDEIHSVCGNKRGVHLSLTLERLQEVAEQEFVRIGLSATQRPLERVAAFLGGLRREGGASAPRPVTVIDAGRRKEMDLLVECAAPDFSLLRQESVWPLVFAELRALIRRHNTTLIFVNNRRLAERVAAELNLDEDREESRAMGDKAPAGSEAREGGEQRPGAERLAGGAAVNLHAVPRETGWTGSNGGPVQAYHGSMSRQARERMEEELKAGRLRALVATSSLELGIDIGSIDLVIQIQSPRGVSRGLQRIGRSGHLVSATSKGRLFPTHREDLVESAVVARAMRDHDVEETVIPENCLDVLAQQIVAMVSVEERGVEELFAVVRQSYCYRNLPRTLFTGVLTMLSGRYTNEAFRELRARISWDKVNGILRPLPGSGRLAVTSGGTIADRGYYGVYLEDGKTKVGEVDEEFVYETRNGDTFILGTNVWRVEEIDANRLTVRAAPGQPARMPFWRGEGIGRSYELGLKVGAFRRAMASALDRADCLSWLRAEYPIGSRAAWNIQEYFRKQRDATKEIPHDRLLIAEGFRDEIGDPRLVVHSSFGKRVNGLLGLVLAHRLRAMTGVEPQMLWNDDGILLRCADADALPMNIFEGFTSAGAGQIALDELLTSPLFGAQFRQNASRALLMPKTAPGKRTPMWLQRLRAGDLLQIARRYDDFPIVIETVREVLAEVLDFEHFKEVARDIEQGAIRIASVETEIPSPFSASLLFDFIAVDMYEWDHPETGTGVTAPNRELLGEIVDLDALQGLIRPEALLAVERQLQHSADGYRARSPEELMEILLRIGDLTEEEILARCDGDGRAMIRTLEADGRAARIELPDGPRWIAGEERDVYGSLNGEESSRFVIERYLQSHGPRTSTEIATRFGTETRQAEELMRRLAAGGEVVRGRFSGARQGKEPEAQEWCYRPTLEKIHRQTITLLRHEITPSTPSAFTSFLFRWHGLSGGATTDIASCLGRLQALPLPAEVWERDLFRSRIPGFTADLLTRFTSAGNGVWVGSGSGRIQFLFRGNGSLYLGPEPAVDRLHEPARRILDLLRREGASFFSDIRQGTRLSLAGMNNGIAELFWDGVITNDVFTELTAVKRLSRSGEPPTFERVEPVYGRHVPDRERLMQRVRRAIRQVPGWTGRWSLVRSPGVMGAPPADDEAASAQAAQLLERYGIVAREFHGREELLPWPSIAAQLQRMELRGEIRRGYFVEGLSGMQFALPPAIEELQKGGPGPDELLLVNACDPANPYGTGVAMPPAGPGGEPLKIARVPGNYIAFEGGTPVATFESWGTRIRSVGEFRREAVREAIARFTDLLRLPSPLRPFREIVVEYCDDQRPAESPLAEELRSLGFVRGANQTMRRDAYE